MLQGDVYEPDTIQYMIDHCGDGAIIHAGTFFGDFLPALAKTGNMVYAFEPVRENWEHAVKTLELNYPAGIPFHNVALMHAGVGEAGSDTTIMWKGGDGLRLGGASRFGYNIHNVRSDQLENTHIVALDDVIPNDVTVTVLQLDVEGHEESALKGCINTIRRCKPHIILEQWSPSMLNTDFYRDAIFALGYTETGMVHDNVVLTP